MRCIAVVLVVVFHSTSAYVGADYIVMDPNSSPVTKIIGSLLVITSLNILFFVAGFFAISSYESKGMWRFIVSKLKRLGIPLVLGCIFIGPMLPYIGYWSQNFNGLESTVYWDFWLNYMKSFGHPGMTGGRVTAEPLFYYQHFWFLSSLLIMFFLFAPFYAIGKRIAKGTSFRCITTEVESNISITLVILLFPLLLSAGYQSGLFMFLGKFLRWRYIPAVLMTQTAYFAFGVYAYSKKWFTNGKVPGPLVFWMIAAILCILGNSAVMRELSFLPTYRTLVWFSGQYLIVAFLGLLGAVTFRFMNRPSSINGKFAASSFSIYIIHFPIVASIQFLMLEWGIPVPVKFVICAVASILVSFAISNYIIRPFPRLSVVGLIGVFALMSLFLHPGRGSDAVGETAITESGPTAGQSPKPETHDMERRIKQQIRYYDEKLNLTDDQKAKLRTLFVKQMKTFEAFSKQLDTQIKEMLTEKQKKKYREMRGGR